MYVKSPTAQDVFLPIPGLINMQLTQLPYKYYNIKVIPIYNRRQLLLMNVAVKASSAALG